MDNDDEPQVEQEPLVICAAAGEEGNVQAIMQTKPPFEVSGRALLAAARCGYPKIADVILKYKADANSKLAAEALDIFIRDHEDLAVVPTFLKAGLRTDSQISGRVLEYAADRGRGEGLRTVEVFLKHKLDPTSSISYKGLELASQSGHENIVSTLLMARASAQSHAGGESLKTASLMGQIKVVRLLLDHNANACSAEGNDALNRAVHIGNEQLTKLLLSSKADASAGLPAAAFRGNHKFVQLLLTKGADGSSKRKAMKEAARFGHQDIMNTLLRSGTDAASPAGDSALRLAVCSGRSPEVKEELVQSLQAYGARRLLSLPALPGSQRESKSTLSRIASASRTWSFGFGRQTSSPPSSRSSTSKLARTRSSPHFQHR
jgi:ankyrin repeat protein